MECLVPDVRKYESRAPVPRNSRRNALQTIPGSSQKRERRAKYANNADSGAIVFCQRLVFHVRMTLGRLSINLLGLEVALRRHCQSTVYTAAWLTDWLTCGVIVGLLKRPLLYNGSAEVRSSTANLALFGPIEKTSIQRTGESLICWNLRNISRHGIHVSIWVSGNFISCEQFARCWPNIDRCVIQRDCRKEFVSLVSTHLTKFTWIFR